MDFIFQWSSYLFSQWWFYPTAVAYLLFGVWFGSLNFKVVSNPDSYPYLVRFLFYPVATVFREGWISTKCLSPAKTPLEEYIGIAFLALYKEYEEAVVIVILALGWFIKVIFNIFPIAAIMTISLLMILLFFYLLIVFALAYVTVWLSSGIAKLFQRLL